MSGRRLGPGNPKTHGWVAAEGLWGNGFLERPEKRQQYKLNGYRAWSPGNHELAIYGAAYYGFSRIPRLIPLDTPVPEETIDHRQADLTHTTIALITDQWQISGKQLLTSGAYFRTYSLNLKSNFGDGLIQQSGDHEHEVVEQFAKTMFVGSNVFMETADHFRNLIDRAADVDAIVGEQHQEGLAAANFIWNLARGAGKVGPQRVRPRSRYAAL